MSYKKIIAGDQNEKQPSGVVIGNDGEAVSNVPPGNKSLENTEARLVKSTESGGLEKLPDNFDELYGDWAIISSANPFEVLYLDYKQYVFIKPAMVEKNYNILIEFWKDKIGVLNTGGNRVALKNKYGDGTVENSLNKLKNAYDKLSSKEGIIEYYREINETRLKVGEEAISDRIEQMLVDSVTDRSEIQLCLDKGVASNLSNDEVCLIIKKHLDDKGFMPYGEVKGDTLFEKLLSVDHWMTKEQIEKHEKFKKERESNKIQILPGKYASSLDEIGQILFEDEKGAKELINENILTPAIAQKDIVCAREIGLICTAKESIELKYIRLIYKLNHHLPFRFTDRKLAFTVADLCSIIMEDALNYKLGKEYLKKGIIEIWLKETNLQAYEKFTTIRDSAENIDVAFIEFIYSFNSSLPYRFAGVFLANTELDLFIHINRSKESWEEGKNELFNLSILTWLKTIGKHTIVDRWNAIRTGFEDSKDVGLEEFLHLLFDEAKYPQINSDKSSLEYPAIQSGNSVLTEFVFANESRGYVDCRLSFTKVIEGVTTSPKSFALNSAAKIDKSKIKLAIDTSSLMKGVNYETTLQIETSVGQTIKIPISFKVVFPKKSFILKTLKYSFLLSALFAFTRFVLSTDYPNALNSQFSHYLDWKTSLELFSSFAIFGWSFLLIVAGLFGVIFYLFRSTRA